MNVIFLPLNKKESRWGWVLAVIYLLMITYLELIVPFSHYWIVCGAATLLLAGLVVTFRGFLKQSVDNLSLIGRSLLWKPLLALLVTRVITIFINDLGFMFQLPYFDYTDWGPLLMNIRSELIAEAAEAAPILIFLSVVLLMPIAEELIFRGVILGQLYEKNGLLAVAASTVLFLLFHTIPYISLSGDSTYLCFYAFQYIPMGLFLCWLYISTDSIFAPMVLHILYNAILLF